MNCIVSFSAREGGNCDAIAHFIGMDGDKIIAMREVSTQPCANCCYECMEGQCKYRADGIYTLFEQLALADKVFFVVPMYCGNPSALYSILSERCQDYFMSHESEYAALAKKLYIIGVYGNQQTDPEFLKGFTRQYGFIDAGKHILGLERHPYHHGMNDRLLDEDEVCRRIAAFIRRA